MADETPHMTPGNKNAHEKSDANSYNLFKIGGALMALIVGSFIAMYFLLKAFEKNPTEPTTQPSAMVQPGELPPEPRLQVHPAIDLEQFHAEEDSVLTTYGWVDKGSGMVRIPVESAMVMVARSGLPFDTSLVKRTN